MADTDNMNGAWRMHVWVCDVAVDVLLHSLSLFSPLSLCTFRLKQLIESNGHAFQRYIDGFSLSQRCIHSSSSLLAFLSHPYFVGRFVIVAVCTERLIEYETRRPYGNGRVFDIRNSNWKCTETRNKRNQMQFLSLRRWRRRRLQLWCVNRIIIIIQLNFIDECHDLALHAVSLCIALRTILGPTSQHTTNGRAHVTFAALQFVAGWAQSQQL